MGSFGFYPLFCLFDGTGDTLSSMLRPGTAGATKVEDHLQLLDSALAAMPAVFQGGHHRGDDPQLTRRQLAARADSARCTEDFVGGGQERNVGLSVVALSCRQIHVAISLALDDASRWQPAVRQHGGRGGGQRWPS